MSLQRAIALRSVNSPFCLSDGFTQMPRDDDWKVSIAKNFISCARKEKGGSEMCMPCCE